MPYDGTIRSISYQCAAGRRFACGSTKTRCCVGIDFCSNFSDCLHRPAPAEPPTLESEVCEFRAASRDGRSVRVIFASSSGVARFTLGHYPALSLAGPREKARTWKEDARGGLDPITEDANREAAAQTKTFAAIVTNYVASQTRLRPTTLR